MPRAVTPVAIRMGAWPDLKACLAASRPDIDAAGCYASCGKNEWDSGQI